MQQGDHANQQLGIATAQPMDVGFQVLEERGIEDHAVLDHFAQAGAELARRQGVERGGVDQHAEGLQERPHHVFGGRQIDPHLAAHRAIDLGQQRGGHLEEADAAGVGGGDEAGQVADHTATDRHDHRLAIGVEFEQAFPQAGGHFDCFGLLARLDGHHGDVDLFAHQAFGHAEGVRLLDVFVGDDDGVRDRPSRCQQRSATGQVSGADFNVVAALGQVDADGLRGKGHGGSYVCFKRSRSAAVTVICRQKPV